MRPFQPGRRDSSTWSKELFWLPNDPVLHGRAPHETAGVLRAHRAGWSGRTISRYFKLGQFRMIAAMSKAIDDEETAHRLGLAVHDESIPKGY